MSARKIPLYKNFLEVSMEPAPAVFPIPEGELVKIIHINPARNGFNAEAQRTQSREGRN